jgi:hypothetical protein
MVWSLKSLAIVAAISTLTFLPVVSSAQEVRRCSFLVQGAHRDAGNCLYREEADYYEVVFNSKKYTLITNTPYPRLFIDGIFTKTGSGGYKASIADACRLFIALSEANEKFNISLHNYNRGLCVSH